MPHLWQNLWTWILPPCQPKTLLSYAKRESSSSLRKRNELEHAQLGQNLQVKMVGRSLVHTFFTRELCILDDCNAPTMYRGCLWQLNTILNCQRRYCWASNVYVHRLPNDFHRNYWSPLLWEPIINWISPVMMACSNHTNGAADLIFHHQSQHLYESE